MEHGYKHFSHSHNLVMHQMPKGVDISCSGCNSSGTGTVYVCWQCNFFLHEQCFRATRSLKHLSHLPHPLTLVPYPTYPSNSFYCNSCEIIGTGFSYSCADCEFDLHVQCAHSISSATNFQQAHQYPTTYYNPNQELVPPGWNGQNSNMAQNQFTGAQNPYMAQNPAYVSIPTDFQNPVNTVQDPSMAQNGPSISVSSSSESPNTSIQYPSIGQTEPHVSIPTSSQTTAQYVPSFPVLTPDQYEKNRIDYVSQFNQRPITSGQNSNMAQNVASFSKPTSNHVEYGENRVKDQGIMHFSHPHGLLVVDLQDGEKQVDCSICKETLVGKGYSCTQPKCQFHLHESCFHLKREIRHESHPKHPLSLFSHPPYNNENGEFTCNACSSNGTGFTYHCSICKFDLHIQCVSLPETVKRSDHEHVLNLRYSFPLIGEEYTYTCEVCRGVVQKHGWTYACQRCNFGTHLDCVNCEKCDEGSTDSVLDAQVQLQRLQLQMEMVRQNAQMMASFGASIANLA